MLMVPFPSGYCPVGANDCVGGWRDDLLCAAIGAIALFFAIRNQIKKSSEDRRKEKFKELSKDLRPKRRRIKRKIS